MCKESADGTGQHSTDGKGLCHIRKLQEKVLDDLPSLPHLHPRHHAPRLAKRISAYMWLRTVSLSKYVFLEICKHVQLQIFCKLKYALRRTGESIGIPLLAQANSGSFLIHSNRSNDPCVSHLCTRILVSCAIIMSAKSLLLCPSTAFANSWECWRLWS